MKAYGSLGVRRCGLGARCAVANRSGNQSGSQRLGHPVVTVLSPAVVDVVDTTLAAGIGAAVSTAIAFPLGRRARRRDVRRGAASELDRELERLARTLGSCSDWLEPWNTTLDLRNRYERRIDHAVIEGRLDALGRLLGFLLLEVEEEVANGHRLPSTSSVDRAITNVRDGLVDLLRERRLSAPTFPTGDELAGLLERWRSDGRRPHELTAAYLVELRAA